MARLADVIDNYVAHRKAGRYSTSTVRNEEILLRKFLASVGNIHVNNITEDHMVKFWRQNDHWADSTFNLARARFGPFFEYCRKKKHMPPDMDPMYGTRNRRVVRPERAIVSLDQFDEFLDSAQTPRDRVVLAIGLYLCTRISETLTLRWRDIDWDKHEIAVTRHKTRDHDYMPMVAELEHELMRWARVYRIDSGQADLDPEWYVVCGYTPSRLAGSTDGHGSTAVRGERVIEPTKPLGITGANKLVKRSLLALGLDQKHAGSHTLRRSGAIALYHELSDRGHDKAVRFVRDWLGHKSMLTTEVYLQMSGDRKERNDTFAGKQMFQRKRPKGTAKVVTANFVTKSVGNG